MQAINHYLAALKKYATFSGRARRKEYWFFVLVNIIVGIILYTLAGLIGGGLGRIFIIIYLVYALAVFLPGLAVSVRRLHDVGKSGWWIFINLIPLIGAIVFIVFMVQDSESGQNEYGPNPKDNQGNRQRQSQQRPQNPSRRQ